MRRARGAGGDRHEVCSECNNNNNDRQGAILQGYKVASIVNPMKKYLPAHWKLDLLCNMNIADLASYSTRMIVAVWLLRSHSHSADLAAGQQPMIAICARAGLLTNPNFCTR